MMAQGLWTLFWLCTSPLYCKADRLLPLKTYNHPAICHIMQGRMQQKHPQDVFVCSKERDV